MHKLTDEIVRDMEDFVMTIGKATLYAIIAIMLAAGPVAAKARKAVTNGNGNGHQTCLQEMGKAETEGEGRSGAKLQVQRLSDCTMRTTPTR
jgi:hypothetical protein